MSKVWLITGSSRGLGLRSRKGRPRRRPSPRRHRPQRPSNSASSSSAIRRSGARRRSRRDRSRRRARQRRRRRPRPSDASTSSSTTPGYANINFHRRHEGGRLPRADRDEPLRRRERHARRAPGAPRAASRARHPDLVHRRSARQPRAGGVPVGEVGPSKGSPRCSRARPGRSGFASRSSNRAAFAPTGPARRCTSTTSATTTRPTVGAFMENVRKSHDAVRGDPAQHGAGHPAGGRRCPSPRSASSSAATPSYLAELVAEQRAAEDAKWRSLSISTDFDGLGDFRETPVAKMLAAMVQGA